LCAKGFDSFRFFASVQLLKAFEQLTSTPISPSGQAPVSRSNLNLF
jgi:hypothetical protein